ncbi:MAG TPA: IS1634 family transposase [Candidatus Syntrophosphaera sp.]|nr:IS1634 family transposase [Candidatus Syntrophosphaera sp.]
MSYLVIQNGKDGKKYAYQCTAQWNSEKKRSVQKRVYLGVHDPQTGELVPRRQRSSRPGQRIGMDAVKEIAKRSGDAQQAILEAMASGPGRSKPDSVLAPSVVEVAEPGCIHLVEQIAASTGLEATLSATFGARLARQLILLAAYQITQADPIYLARPWLEKTLGKRACATLKFQEEGALLNQLGADPVQRMTFLKAWALQRKHPQALIYDITSVSTYSELLDLAEWGYNRDDEPMRQVNLASVHDRSDGLPLFYRVLPGSISDVTTLTLTSELMTSFGYSGFHFVMDRGFFSQANASEMLQNGIGFTMAIPLTSTQAKAFVQARHDLLARPKNALVWAGRPIYHRKGPWLVTHPDKSTGSCQAHLFLDPQRKSDEEERLLGRVLVAEQLASKQAFLQRHQAHSWMAGNADPLRKYLTVRKDPSGAWCITRKNNVLAQRMATMGLSLILTTDDQLTSENVWAEYRSRDRIEKAFDVLKNENGQFRMYVSSREQAEGRLFLAFLALIISCDLHRRMRKAGLYKKYTTQEVLTELSKIRALRMDNDQIKLLEVSKTQRTLLASLGVEPVQASLVIN